MPTPNRHHKVRRAGIGIVGGMACAVLFLAACGYGSRNTAAPASTPAPASTSTPGELKLDLSGYKFTPEIVEVQAGKQARFVLVGDGLAHTFTIAAIGVDIAIPAGTKSQTVQFTVPQNASGELKLTCALHELAGMVGTVRVK